MYWHTIVLNPSRNPVTAETPAMFKNLDSFDIRHATTYVEVPELGPGARILVGPANESNPNYYNAMLAMSGKRVRQAIKTDKITAEDSALNRDDDAVLFPRFVIKGFENVEGDPDTAQPGELDENDHVIYSRSAAQKLCAVLNEKAPHVLDRIRNTASTPERFYADDEIGAPDADELAGN
jgi:hypothetical protein